MSTITPPSRTIVRTPSRVTLRTLADATGLSVSTVSLALRGGTTLRAETQEKVAEAARALGYVPDRAGVRLRTGKTNVVALVLDGSENSFDFARQMIQGIGMAMRGTRYHLTVMPEFDRDPSTDTIRYILENRTADGVIVTHTSPRDPRVQMMIDAGFPFVSHGRTEFFSPHAFHDFRAERFVETAVTRLVALGRERIVLAAGDGTTTNFHTIVTSFRRAVAENGIAGELLPIANEASPLDIRGMAHALASAKTPPDGLVIDGEMLSIALIGGLVDAGLVVPRDLSIVYKQTSGLLPSLFPRIDSIREDIRGAGAELTRLLLRRIAGDPVETLQTLADPEPCWRN